MEFIILLIVVGLVVKSIIDQRNKSGRAKKRQGAGPEVLNEDGTPVGGKRPKMPSFRGGVKYISWVLIGIVVLSLVFGSYYKVEEQEQAVVTMFGRVLRTDSAGLYWKIPILQRVHKVNTTTSGMPIGYRVTDGYEDNGDMAYTSTVGSEASMITSDFNFVNVDFYLEYRVSDPVQYLYASADPEGILQNETQAAIRSTIAKYNVDDVITTGKSQIQAEVKEKLVNAMNENNIGIQVVNVLIQDAEPPTEEIMAAFKAVETAKQGAQTASTQANQYKNEKIPAAEANADKIRQTAEAAKEARIAEATGQVERFNRMYEEYSKYPLVTKQRLFYETIEDVLPGLKVIITDGKTNTVYPLDSFTEKVQESAGAAVEQAE